MGKKSRRSRSGPTGSTASSATSTSTSNGSSNNHRHHKTGEGTHHHHKLHDGPLYNRYHPQQKSNQESANGLENGNHYAVNNGSSSMVENGNHGELLDPTTATTTTTSPEEEPSTTTAPIAVVTPEPKPNNNPMEEMTIEFAQEESSHHEPDAAILTEEVQPAPKLFANAFASAPLLVEEEETDNHDDKISNDGGAVVAAAAAQTASDEMAQIAGVAEDEPQDEYIFSDDYDEEDNVEDNDMVVDSYALPPMLAAIDEKDASDLPPSLNDTQDTEVTGITTDDDKVEEDHDENPLINNEDSPHVEPSSDRALFLGDIDENTSIEAADDDDVIEEEATPSLQESVDTQVSRSVDLLPPVEATATFADASGSKDPENTTVVAERWLKIFVALLTGSISRRLVQFYYVVKGHLCPPGKILSPLLFIVEVVFGVSLVVATIFAAVTNGPKFALPKLLPKFVSKQKKEEENDVLPQVLTNEDFIQKLGKGTDRHDVIGAEYAEMEAIMEEPTNHSDVHEDALEVRSDQAANETKQPDATPDTDVTFAIPKSLSVDTDDSGPSLSDLDADKDTDGPGSVSTPKQQQRQQSSATKKKRKNIFACLVPKGVKKMMGKRQARRQAKRALRRASAVYDER
mmetsp:Transcript_16868/g.46317  ORF Transcript_16868/g.46317 Transcript_16868/m.46317 type:complete len:630 (+) Transcript_16868:264-2153(+)